MSKRIGDGGRRAERSAVARAAWAMVVVIGGVLGPHAAAQLPFGGGRETPAMVFDDCSIISMVGEDVERGRIVVREGRIADLGADVRPPRGSRTISLRGGVVTPGLIDPWSALGLDPGGPSGSANALHKAADLWDPYAEDAFKDALSNGVLFVYIAPPGGRGILGRGATVKLTRDGARYGEQIGEDGWLAIDLASGASATERLGAFGDVRKAFRGALNYREAQEIYDEELEEYLEKLEERAKKEEDAENEADDDAGGDDDAEAPPDEDGDKNGGEGDQKKDEDEIKKPKRPDPNRQFDLLLEALDGEIPVRVRAERSADILNALELKAEFDLDVTIVGGAEAHLVADEIAEADSGVVLGPTVRGGLYSAGQFGRLDPAGAGRLRAAGVDVSFSGGGETGRSRFVLMSAQLASQYGGPDADIDALRAVTRGASSALGLGRRAGRLYRSGPADFVVWSSDPRKGGARVEQVYIGGKPVYMRPRSGR